MLGYSEMKEVLLWIQTEKSSAVKFEYWDKENPKKTFFTDEIQTKKENVFVAKCIADSVQPGKQYNYAVWLNNKKMTFNYPLTFQTQTLWAYRTDPPNFKFAFGSCHYTNESEVDRPGKPYGNNMGIFEKIYEQKPNFMVWGGDNIYLREVDWHTQTGINHRYTEFKRQKELQPLWANVHHYAIWDDHDYGPNDADRSFWGKYMALKSFKNFWGNLNYIYENEATTGTFQWEDCHFFLMDNRWFRAPNGLVGDDKDYYGEKQLNWLIDALTTSQASFKFVVTGGQIVNNAKVFENMANYPDERQKLFDKLVENKISGVIFISGDRHHTNLQKMERVKNYPLYDLTVSPFSSGAGKPRPEEYASKTIIPSTELNETQNFGILVVSGERKNRILKINIFDAQGQKKWDYTINANDLKVK